MSVSEDRTVQPSPTTPVPGSGIADPAPLGLAAFALTTFLLSAQNAGWMTHATGDAWLPFALAYGGLAQLLAAMWEFRNRNVVGATALRHLRRLLDRPRLLYPARSEPGSRGRQDAARAGGDGHGHQPRPRLDPARVRRLHHVHADPGQSDEHGLVRHLPPPVDHPDRPVHRELQRWRSTRSLPQQRSRSAATSAWSPRLVAWYTSAADFSTGMGGKLRFPVGPPLIK